MLARGEVMITSAPHRDRMSRPCGGKTRFEARATDTGGLGTAAASKAKVTQLTTGARCRASKAQPVFPATGTTGVP